MLDNVEHLPGVWPMLARMESECPGVTLLVTSRERLRLDEEWVHELEGLRDDDAVELFRQRAERYTDLIVTESDALDLIRAVGGSPLAIELAASWLRVMTVAEVGNLVRDDPGMLADDRRDRVARHRSIDAAMAHSWALASPEERAGVEGLSVFAAPYSRALAEEVARVTPLVLRDLVDKSLVQRRGDDRYASHPLVRQYAAARLSIDHARRRELRDRHARVVLGALPGEDAPAPLHLLDDAVLGWQHSVDVADVELLRDTADSLVGLLTAASRLRQTLPLLQDAEATCAQGSDALAAIRHNQSLVLNRLGRHREAMTVADDAVSAARTAGDRRRVVQALLALAWARKTVDGDEAQYAVGVDAMEAAGLLSDPVLTAEVRNTLGCSAPTLAECRRHLQAALDVVDRDSLSELRIRLLGNLGSVQVTLGNLSQGIELASEGLRCSRAANRLPRVVDYLGNLASCWAEAGDFDRAERLVTEAEELLDRVEDPDQRIFTTVIAGEIHRRRDDPAGAWLRMRDALAQADAAGHEALLLRCLRLYGQLLLDAGETEEALRTLAVVMAGPTRKGDFTSIVINPRVWAEATEGIDPPVVAAAKQRADGRSAAALAEQVLREEQATAP